MSYQTPPALEKELQFSPRTHSKSVVRGCGSATRSLMVAEQDCGDPGFLSAFSHPVPASGKHRAGSPAKALVAQ